MPWGGTVCMAAWVWLCEPEKACPVLFLCTLTIYRWLLRRMIIEERIMVVRESVTYRDEFAIALHVVAMVRGYLLRFSGFDGFLGWCSAWWGSVEASVQGSDWLWESPLPTSPLSDLVSPDAPATSPWPTSRFSFSCSKSSSSNPRIFPFRQIPSSHPEVPCECFVASQSFRSHRRRSVWVRFDPEIVRSPVARFQIPDLPFKITDISASVVLCVVFRVFLRERRLGVETENLSQLGCVFLDAFDCGHNSFKDRWFAPIDRRQM